MSSSIKSGTSKDSNNKIEKLSLFDQLKNSKDHNSVNKISTALAIKANQHNTAKCKDLNDEPATETVSPAAALVPVVAIKDDLQKPKNTEVEIKSISNTVQSSSGALVKPEFYPPSVPAGVGSGGGVTSIAASVKRAANLLKRSQKQHQQQQQMNGTKKTALLTSATAGLGNLLTSTSTASSTSSSLASSTVTSALTNGVAALAAHHHHQHHHKKKRCTDRYDSSESSDR